MPPERGSNNRHSELVAVPAHAPEARVRLAGGKLHAVERTHRSTPRAPEGRMGFESQRDSILQPSVAPQALRWENRPPKVSSTLKGLHHDSSIPPRRANGAALLCVAIAAGAFI